MLYPRTHSPVYPGFGQFDPRTPEHFLFSAQDSLYDTRNGFKKPLREQYRGHKTIINTPQDLLATLRAGPYTWPGVYPLFFLTSEGGALSFETVREELRNVLDAIRTKCDDGWRVAYCAVNWEDTELFDSHTGESIPAAYSGD